MKPPARRAGFAGFYEDFEVGDVIAHTVGKTVGESEHMQMTQLCRNSHPIHFDEVYCKDNSFAKTRVVYGGLVLSWVLALTSRDITGNAVWDMGLDQGAHPSGVIAGDTLYANSKVLEKEDAGPHAGVLTLRVVGTKNTPGGDLVERGLFDPSYRRRTASCPRRSSRLPASCSFANAPLEADWPGEHPGPMVDWYVRHQGEDAIGPVDAELLVRGIAAGKVPVDAEVCEAGTDEWLPLEAIEDFQDALPDDGVQTRVIESPWFMNQTNRSTPGATLPGAYSEDDDAATRVASTPFGDSQPGVALPSAPRPAAGAAARPRPARPSRPPPPAPVARARRHLRPTAPRAPRHLPRLLQDARRTAATPGAASVGIGCWQRRALRRGRRRRGNASGAGTQRAGAELSAPRPAAGAPAGPPAPPALTPLPTGGQAASAPERPVPAAPGAAPPLQPPSPAAQPAERSLLPLVLLIVMLALALAVVLILLARG